MFSRNVFKPLCKSSTPLLLCNGKVVLKFHFKWQISSRKNSLTKTWRLLNLIIWKCYTWVSELTAHFLQNSIYSTHTMSIKLKLQTLVNIITACLGGPFLPRCALLQETELDTCNFISNQAVPAYLIHVYELQTGFLQRESEKRNSCRPPLFGSICSLLAQQQWQPK